MFRSELQEKLSAIFGLRKTTFDAPSDAYEQDTLFIEVQSSVSRAADGRAYSRVNGSIVVFSQNNKLPYGYFHKRLSKADPDLTRNLFFYDLDTDALNSQARLLNIAERRASFVFLFSTEYDPAQGSLTGIEFDARLWDAGDGNIIDSGGGPLIKG